MIPIRIKLRNFLAFGDPPVEIDFEDEPLWVISGPNGVGKSSIFDAITYALFGQHRGGNNQNMDQLIRHGTDGFSVVFDFRHGGREFRIERNYADKGYERIFELKNNDHEEIQLTNARNKVGKWIEANLGLQFEQFTASVMLRQGDADELIQKGGTHRQNTLKQMLDVARYESLSELIHKKKMAADKELVKAQSKVNSITEVSDDDLNAATESLKMAEETLAEANNAERLANARVGEARQFEQSELDLKGINAKIDAARMRLTNSDDIRQRYGRWQTLGTVLPKLTENVGAYSTIQSLKPELERITGELQEIQGQIQIVERCSVIDNDLAQLKSQLKRSQQIAICTKELSGFPSDLNQLCESAKSDLDLAEKQLAQATKAQTESATLLRQAENILKAYQDVTVGVKCSHCRQLVTAEIAEKEKQALTARVAELRENVTRARSAQEDAERVHADKKTKYDALKDDRTERDQLKSKLDGLNDHGSSEPVADLESRIAVLSAERKGYGDTQPNLASLKTNEQKLNMQRNEIEPKLNRAKLVIEQSNLSVEWASIRTKDELHKLEKELQSLKTSNVESDYTQLLGDEARLADLEQIRLKLQADIDAIPAESRIPVADAQRHETKARQARTDAASAQSDAKQQLKTIEQRREDRTHAVAAERVAEANARHHKRLDELLGKDGLQRDLVRSAERKIVVYANEVIRRLSDNELGLELEVCDTDDTDTFSLLVRKADLAKPIGIDFVSGSQRFRVAVAVALAIGKFSGSEQRNCPLESVIIDEGFGSLDKDGLRCMADELRLLKDKSDLKKIILVSHQDEFVNNFPVGWQLTPDPLGTKAEKFRRS